jgi:hypothetical protein
MTERYEGGAGDLVTQWIGWSLELVSQAGQICSSASFFAGGESCSWPESRYIGIVGFADQYGETGNLGMAYRGNRKTAYKSLLASLA